MKTTYAERLAQIRAQWLMWNAQTDTSHWEVTFLLKLLDEKDLEIAQLRPSHPLNK